MSGQLTPVDISNNPELVHLAEEVEATKQPRELKRENKIVAVLMPTDAKRKTSIQHALALAGAWKDIPSEAMEEKLQQIRHQSKTTAPFAFDEE